MISICICPPAIFAAFAQPTSAINVDGDTDSTSSASSGSDSTVSQMLQGCNLLLDALQRLDLVLPPVPDLGWDYANV